MELLLFIGTKKEEEAYPEKFKILKIKTYGISKDYLWKLIS